MKKALILCVVTFLVLMGILAYAEFGMIKPSAAASPSYQAMMRSATGTHAFDSTRVENEIKEILDQYYRIARTNDRQALENFSREISAPEYLYSSELGVKDKTETLRFVDSLNRKFLKTEYEDLQVQSHGDTAVVKYLEVSLVKSNWGMKRLKQTRFTSFWVKRDGKWQIAAEHSSVLAPTKLAPRHPWADNMAKKK